MENKVIIIFLTILLLAFAVASAYWINQKNNEIKKLDYDLTKLHQANFYLQNEKTSLSAENQKLMETLAIFRQHLKNKDSAAEVRNLLAYSHLKLKGLGSENQGFKFGPELPSLDELYNITGDEKLKLTIQNICPQEFYKKGELSEKDSETLKNFKSYCSGESIESCPDRVKESIKNLQMVKKSYPVHYYTIYATDITSDEYKQRAVVYFDDEFNIICSWKYEKPDPFSFEGDPVSLESDPTQITVLTSQ